VLTAVDLARTADSIAAMQEPSGAIPWTPGQHVDVWNHIEAAMALLTCGRVAEAERAHAWVRRTQRHDGSWPMKVAGGQVEDASGETNMSAYPAVGVWHHWLLRRDLAFVEQMWPVVRRGLDFVTGMQLPFGGIAWSQEWDVAPDGTRLPAKVNEEALLAGSSSIYQSLRAGVALADLMDDPQPGWELAGGRLGHALREHRDLFLDKATFSMDWYYPILGGAVRGRAGIDLVAERWDRFVVPGLGIKCVDTNNWVTGAETCELVMALDALDDHQRAVRLFADMQHLRDLSGAYWTGYVYPDDVNGQGSDSVGAFWPQEHTTYTAAAVILAADELSRTTPGSGIMRGDTLGAHFSELALECGCESVTTSPSSR
jgi:hypothetical protein